MKRTHGQKRIVWAREVENTVEEALVRASRLRQAGGAAVRVGGEVCQWTMKQIDGLERFLVV